MGYTRKVRKATRMPRKLAQKAVVVSTSVLDSAVNGVHKALKRLTKGTRSITKSALFLNKSKKSRRRRSGSRRRRRRSGSRRRRRRR
tara:strand:- start:190 stop:450 length:261 start_codon:yes stop_codon:yes gene_type:complete